MKKKILCLVSLCALMRLSYSQNLFTADTFTYTINLDLSQNLYLKSVPVDLLKGYCRGDWNAYYPQKEMNQCLFDDFLKRFDHYQLNVPVNSEFCWDDYCNDPYFKDLFSLFARKLKYKEVIYYDNQHSIVKREVLWVQVFYSMSDVDGWKHFNGPVFWLMEIKGSDHPVMVYNKDIRATGWPLEEEFQHAGFIVNKNKQKDDKKKIERYNNMEEN